VCSCAGVAAATRLLLQDTVGLLLETALGNGKSGPRVAPRSLVGRSSVYVTDETLHWLERTVCACRWTNREGPVRSQLPDSHSGPWL
jgi:hypothetical protein